MIISIKKQVYALLSALLLVLPVMSGIATASCKEESLSRNARMALVKAQEHMKNKETAKARITLLDFIEKNPRENHHFVESTLAGLFYDQNQMTKALAHYQKSVDLCPSYGPGWQNLGKICFDHKLFARSALAMEKAYVLDKQKNPQLRFHAAVAHISANAPGKALGHMEFLTSGRAEPPQYQSAENPCQSYPGVEMPGQGH